MESDGCFRRVRRVVAAGSLRIQKKKKAAKGPVLPQALVLDGLPGEVRTSIEMKKTEIPAPSIQRRLRVSDQTLTGLSLQAVTARWQAYAAATGRTSKCQRTKPVGAH